MGSKCYNGIEVVAAEASSNPTRNLSKSPAESMRDPDMRIHHHINMHVCSDLIGRLSCETSHHSANELFIACNFRNVSSVIQV